MKFRLLIILWVNRAQLQGVRVGLEDHTYLTIWISTDLQKLEENSCEICLSNLFSDQAEIGGAENLSDLKWQYIYRIQVESPRTNKFTTLFADWIKKYMKNLRNTSKCIPFLYTVEKHLHFFTVFA